MVELSFFRLFIWTAILFYTVQCQIDIIQCNLLDPLKELKQQMKTCEGAPFKFKDGTGKFDLTNWDQDTFTEIFYDNKKNLKLISGNVVVRNTTMEKLDIYFTMSGNNLEVVGNTKLIKLSVKQKHNNPFNVKVRGNKLLRNKWIEKLKKLPTYGGTKDVQESGECDFDNKPIADMSNLDRCVYVTGNLKIDSNTNGNISLSDLKLTQIKGCLEIAGSSLNNLDFLEKITSITCSQNNKITGNANLCLNSEQKQMLTGVLANVDFSGNQDCDDTCTANFAVKNPSAECTYVTGDININSGNEGQVAIWDRIKQLDGTITVVDTKIENMTIFTNLNKIVQKKGGKNALHILNNQNVRIFKMPNLTTIDMPESVNGRPFVWEKNGNFMFTHNEKLEWLNITNRTHLHIPVDPSTIPTPPPTTPAPPTTTTKSALELKQEELDKDHEDKNRKSVILYITSGAIGLGLVLFFLYFVIIYCINKYKRNKERRRMAEGFLEHKKFIAASRERSKEVIPTPSPDTDSDISSSRSSLRAEITKIIDVEEKDLDEYTRYISVFLDFAGNNYTFKRIRKRIEAGRRAAEQSLKAPYISLANFHEPASEALKKSLKTEQMIQIRKKAEIYDKMIRFPTQFLKYTYNLRHFHCVDAQPDTLDVDPKSADLTNVYGLVKRLLGNTGDVFKNNPRCFIHAMEWCAIQAKKKCYSDGCLRKVKGNWRIIGDIHGSIADLLVILNTDPNQAAAGHGLHPIHYYRFIFLGDYVDRGIRSLECFGLLCLLGALYPDNFVVCRGNHEALVNPSDKTYVIRPLIQHLKKQKRKGYFHLAERMIRSALEVVQYLPLAALINDQIFCAHGGISHTMQDLGETLDEVFDQFNWPYRTAYEREFLNTPWARFGTQKYYNEDVASGAGKANFIRNKPDLFPLEESNKEEQKWKKMAGDFESSKFQANFMREYAKRRGDLKGKFNKGDEKKFFETLDRLATDLHWNDYCPKITNVHGHRGPGGTYGDSLMELYNMKYNIEMGVFAHVQLFFACNTDGTVWILFGCNNTLASAHPTNVCKKVALGAADWTGVIDMTGDDQFRLIMYQQTTQKDKNEAILGKKDKTKPRDISEIDAAYFNIMADFVNPPPPPEQPDE